MTDLNSNAHPGLPMPGEAKTLLFQVALDQSYNSVVITDANTKGDGPRIIYANPSFEKMTGYTLCELIGKSPKILQGPLTDQRVIEEMRLCIQSGTFFEGSAINYNKNGAPYNVEWSISPIKDQSGVIQNFISVQRNVTTLIAVQQKRSLLAKALNDTPDCVMITDIQNRIIFVNIGFEQLTGYKQDEVLGKEPSFLWGSKPETAPDNIESRLSNLHFQSHAPNLRKDGSKFYVDQSMANIQDDAGKVTHYVSFSKDSTDRLKQELELKDMASTDALTGLLNRRAGEQLLKQYDDMTQPVNNMLCLIMLDIDNFKKINDTFGHVIGDQALKSCSQLLKSEARATDSVIRWGGEEFLIVVSNSTLKATLNFAERIRKSFELNNESTVGFVTASFGVAQMLTGESTASLLNRADKALYKAKLEGRNCVKCAKQPILF